MLGEAAGREWLSALPGWIDRCAERWGLRMGPPFELSFAWVAPATRADGETVVVKIGLELDWQAAALRAYGGAGAVRLLDEAPEAGGALLLEHLRSGRMLAELPRERDDEATAVLAGLMNRLWRAPDPAAGFPPLAAYAADLDAAQPTGPLTGALLSRARRLFAELLASAPAPVLLHGDLHHHNVLAARREPWLAIDPKGIAGDPGYDAGAFLYNPLSLEDPGALAERRLRVLAAELGLDIDRLRAWGFVAAVLSEAWHVEAAGRVGGRGIGVALALSAA